MAVLVNRGTVIAGVRSPRALVIDLVPSDSVPDLSVVTGASLKVWRANNETQIWTCSMSAQTAETLTLTHPWAAGENDIVGEGLRIYPQLTIGSDTVEALAVIVTVTQR
jgi:hypothetical protein